MNYKTLLKSGRRIERRRRAYEGRIESVYRNIPVIGACPPGCAGETRETHCPIGAYFTVAPQKGGEGEKSMYEVANLISNVVSSIAAAILAVAAILTLPSMAKNLSKNLSIKKRIGELTTMITHDPKDASLYVVRGDLFYIQRDYAHAAEDYNKAFEIDFKYKNVAEKRLDAIEKWLKSPD
jgi:tetratricopeptide (TPR) repeat protein